MKFLILFAILLISSISNGIERTTGLEPNVGSLNSITDNNISSENPAQYRHSANEFFLSEIAKICETLEFYLGTINGKIIKSKLTLLIRIESD